MTWVNPPIVATGDFVTANLWNTYIRSNGLHLRGLLPDAGSAGQLLAATGTTSAAFRALTTGDFPDGSVTDVKLALQKVQALTTIYTTFSAVAALGKNGFYEAGPPANDGPTTGTAWYCIQNVEGNNPTGYVLQLAVNIYDQNLVYMRTIVGGSAGAWRKVWHDGNLTGGTMTGNLTFATTLQGIILAGGGKVRDDVSINTTQLICNGDHLQIAPESGSGAMLDITPTGAAFQGAITAPSATFTTGGAPMVVSSSTMVTNLNANLLQGQTVAGIQAGVVTVPSGLIAAFASAGAIASGWVRYTAADGRLLVGAGTLFSVTWTEGTTYGSAWSHSHATSWSSHNHSGASLGVTGTTGNNSASGQSAGTGTSRADDPHTHGSGSLDVSGNTDNAGGGGTSADTWTIPSLAVVWSQKT